MVFVPPCESEGVCSARRPRAPAGSVGVRRRRVNAVQYRLRTYPSPHSRARLHHSATAVARHGRIYRRTLYGDFCSYES